MREAVAHGLSTGLSALCLGAMSVTLAALLIRYFVEPFVPGFRLGRIYQPPGSIAVESDDLGPLSSSVTRQMRRRIRRNQLSIHHQLRILAFIFTAWAFSRALIFVTAAVGCWIQGDFFSFVHNLEGYWGRWDALNYMTLAEEGYVSGTASEMYLAFYPLYPILIRLIRPLFLGNTFLAGTVLSNICLMGAGWLMYQLTFEQQGERAAKRAVRFLMFCPMSVFFSIPYTESMFLLLTLGAVYLARHRFFAPAVLAGILAAGTRMLGLVVAVPIYYEMLRQVHARALWPRRKGRHISLIVGYTLMASLISLGFLAYLLLNWRVSGNPFQFLIYQEHNWHQNFGSIWNSLGYSVWQAIEYGDAVWQLSLWIPQSVSIIGAVALLIFTLRRSSPGDGAFFWIYLFCALAPTWLLSGSRYIAAAYALYPMMTLITREKWQDMLVMGIFVMLLILFSFLYAVSGTLM